jgi:hypothetical protein
MRRLVCPVSESRRKAGQSKRRCRILWIVFQSDSEFKSSGRLADGLRERMGQAVAEFCRKSKPKAFFILFQNGTKLPRQSGKILPMVTFVLKSLPERSRLFRENVSQKKQSDV